MRSLGSVKAIHIEKEEILERLREVTRELKNKLPYVKEVRLFGSFARGEEHGLSDVDLLVIVEDIGKDNFWEVYGEVFDIVSDKLFLDFDLVVLSEKDFLSNPNKFGPTLPIA